ncbi:hypothetical protein IFM89_016538 [Coptis chinensis]|uniref:Uncharacterized protein n=1 Tax=Coptis chinensis TaxID=261450 RepID=A0A835IPQ9_9MAGN|nr:hypothetical protein IFM89_016538 [Coptis chinensis]
MYKGWKKSWCLAYNSIELEAPIVSGREPTASEDERKLGVERSGELSGKANHVSF